MKLSCLLYEGEYSSLCQASEVEVGEIVTDTSKITDGCVFICLCGTRYNTHKILPFIEKKGASAIIVEEGESYESSLSTPIFTVKSTRLALSFAYARFYSNPQNDLRIIGITGTNGKTSSSYILRSVLRRAGYKVGLIGTVECLIENRSYSLPDNTQNADKLKTMTTPDPEVLYKILRLMADEKIDFVVMEVSSHALTQKKTAPIFFELGIFTNLAPEHLDFHVDMESYMRAKAELFKSCKCGIFNIDNDYSERIIAESKCEIVRCSVAGDGDFYATDVKLLGSRGVEYLYRGDNIRISLKSKMPAVFTVYNSLLAITASLKLGVPIETAKEALSLMSSVSGRMERIHLGREDDEFSVFIDYAHTESALRNILSTIRSFRRGNERIVLLFGCGGNRDRSKRAPMGRAAEELADFTIVTSDNSRNEPPRQIIKDILSGMNDINRRRVIMNRQAAIEYAIINAKRNDIIVLAGKGHELYRIDKNGEYFFDERKIVSEALEKRRNGDNKNNEN